MPMSDQYFHERDTSVKTAFGNIQKIAGAKIEGDSHAGSGIVVVPDSTTDKQVVINFPAVASGLKSVVLVSSVDMTVEYNDGSAPTATLSLKAGIPYIWDINSYDTNVQTAATTNLYLTNASGSEGEFVADTVFDGTP
jgi:hypothetical protein